MSNFTKNLVRSAFGFAVLFCASGLLSSADAATALVQQVQGEVLVLRSTSTDGAWSPINADTPLESSDSVKTRNGSCVLTYTDQGAFTLGPNTEVTVREAETTQDIDLAIGKIYAKVNKEKVTKPFQVMTATAVAAVRGTTVNFEFDENGQLTAELEEGKIQVFNDDAELDLDLEGNKTIKVKYDAESNTLYIKNECGSDGVVKFNVLGTEYSENPCDELTIELATAEGEEEDLNTPNNDPGENPNEGREPITET